MTAPDTRYLIPESLKGPSLLRKMAVCLEDPSPLPALALEGASLCDCPNPLLAACRLQRGTSRLPARQ